MEPEMIARNTRQLVVLTGLMSALGGAALGVAASMKFFKLKYEQIAQDEIEEAKRFYNMLEQKPASPLDMVEQYEPTPGENVLAEPTEQETELMKGAVRAMHDYTGHHAPSTVAEPRDEVVQVTETPAGVHVEVNVDKNVFEPDTEYTGWNIERELASRTPDQPYVISKQEFLEGALDYQQPTITWFDGDEVLVDEQSVPTDVAETIGVYNLERFGHGSGDNNIVYVRNEKLELDFEVLRSDGKFAQQVYGFIEHSHRPGKRKDRRFRGDDE